MTINRAAFFAAVRSSLFGGRLNGGQVQGLDALLDTAPAEMPLEHLAYCLATAFHETNETMQPVVENLNYTTAARIRAVWPTRFPTEASAKPFVKNPQKLANKVYGGRMGNTGANDGWTYRGRGFVQITGKDNYERAGKKLLTDLVKSPELATHCGTAASILYAGMAEGWFTGKKLSDYFRHGLTDPYNARRIVNGLDRASDIAGYYHKFLAALEAAKVAGPSVVPPPPDIEPIAPIPQPTNAAAAALVGGLVAAVVAIAAYLGLGLDALKAMIP
jgi:putative chitinase